MSKDSLYRLGAFSLVGGAVLVTLANLLAPQGDARAAVASAGYYPAAVVGVIFGIATIRARVFSLALGTSFVVLSVASLNLGFLSLPGGGGLHLSWWRGTTGTFGVVAYTVGMAWYGIELFRHLLPTSTSARLMKKERS